MMRSVMALMGKAKIMDGSGNSHLGCSWQRCRLDADQQADQTVLEMDLVQIPKSAYGASQSMWHACPPVHLRAAR